MRGERSEALTGAISHFSSCGIHDMRAAAMELSCTAGSFTRSGLGLRERSCTGGLVTAATSVVTFWLRMRDDECCC